MSAQRAHPPTHFFGAVWFTMDERWAREEDEEYDDDDNDEDYEGASIANCCRARRKGNFVKCRVMGSRNGRSSNPHTTTFP